MSPLVSQTLEFQCLFIILFLIRCAVTPSLINKIEQDFRKHDIELIVLVKSVCIQCNFNMYSCIVKVRKYEGVTLSYSHSGVCFTP